MTINTGQINAPSAPIAIGGITLSEFRQRLRVELSGYAASTLISNSNPDTELQFINDGIGQLYPYDFQIVNRSIAVIGGRGYYYLPPDCEHVFSVSQANKDVNERAATISRMPHGDTWSYESSFIDALTPTLEDGTTWTDSTQKVLRIDPCSIGTYGLLSTQQAPSPSTYLIVKYARRWPSLVNETNSVDPSPSRIQAVVYFACAQFFRSQQEVNSESVRYNNYVSLANQFTQQAMAQLIRDPRQLYIL